VRYCVAVLAAVLAGVLATPAQAAETSKKVERKTVVVTAGGDEDLTTQGAGECCKIVTIGEDGKKKVIRLKGGQLLDDYATLDTAARLKLMDAKITHLKATGQLKIDLAVKRLEAEELELAGKADADVVAKKKEINALKAKLADAELDYEQTVKKLVPEGTYDLDMLGIGDETGLSDLDLSLPGDGQKRVIKRIVVRGDDDEEEGG
jgi:hypothetical protein